MRQLVAHSRGQGSRGRVVVVLCWSSPARGPVVLSVPPPPPPPPRPPTHPTPLSDGRFGRVAAARPGHCNRGGSERRTGAALASALAGVQTTRGAGEGGGEEAHVTAAPTTTTTATACSCANAKRTLGRVRVGGRTSAAMLAALRRPFAPTASCSVGSPGRPCTVVGATRHGAYGWGGGHLLCSWRAWLPVLVYTKKNGGRLPSWHIPHEQLNPNKRSAGTGDGYASSEDVHRQWCIGP